MGVAIHKAWGHDKPVRIDGLRCCIRDPAYCLDTPLKNTEVCGVARETGTINNRSATYHEIKHSHPRLAC